MPRKVKRSSIFRSAFGTLLLSGVLASACTSRASATAVAEASVTMPRVTSSPLSATVFTPTASPVVQFDSQLAMAAIRELMEAPELMLTFVETTLMINSPNADLVVAVLADDTGSEYSVDPATYRVVELAPVIYAISGGTRLTQADLRATAQAMAGRYLVGFSEIKDRLAYEEGAKGDNFFFRWEDPTISWTYNPPVFQVGLRVDGKLVSYLNTIPGP